MSTLRKDNVDLDIVKLKADWHSLGRVNYKMAERLVQNIASDYLTCSICWNVFTDPKMLSCGHSFCTKCLYDYIKNVSKSKSRDGFDCPICRFSYTIDSEPEDMVNSFSPDVTSIKILQAIGLDGTRLKTVAENPKKAEKKETDLLEEGNFFCTCKRHPGKRLEVYCSNHDVVVCSECAWRSHRGSECECSSAQEVILKRLKALKSLASQQNDDANRLLKSRDPEMKCIPNVQEAFFKSITEVEKGFKVVCDMFTDRVVQLRAKVVPVINKHPAIVEMKELRENLEEKLNCFEDEQIGNVETNPNMSLRSLSELCEISSEYQRSIIELTEKLESREVMKCLENDINGLHTFVSSAKSTLPKELLSAEDSLYQEDEFVLVSKTGDCKDFYQKENISDLKYQQFVFSAKLPEEKHCMLSSAALIGTTAVVIVDQMNKKIKKFKIPEGRYLDSINPPAEPHQVAVLKDSSDIIVTLWEEHSIIQLSTDPKLEILRVIDTNAEYTGITSHITEHIAVSSIRSKRVDVFHISETDRDNVKNCSLDHTSKTIYRSCGKRCFPDRIASTSGGSIIVRNRRRNEVSCFTRDGVNLWSRRLLSSAADVTSIRGRVFATLQSKNAIVSFQEDGQGFLVYLEPERAFNKPWSVDGFKDCLVVTEDNSSEWVHLFVFA